MYKKVFEKKFRDAAEATDFLDLTGWQYRGKKGLLRKYHLYTGVTMDVRDRVVEAHKLRLHPDGHVELFNDYSISATISTSELPMRVWPSKDIFDHLNQTVVDLNAKLKNDYGHEFFLQWDADRKFSVYKLESQNQQLGKTIKKPAVISFEGPALAFEWAASESERLGTK